MRLTRTRAALVAGVVALVGAGVALGVAQNDYADAQGVYHACVNKTNGNLRVVEPGTACRRHEDAIDWNRIGPRGLRGPQGEQGERGPRGPAGPEGERGERGPQGLQGPQGDTGATGPQGPRGPAGPEGPPGPGGPQGIPGPEGPKGDPGPAGPEGPAGPQGPAGPAGAQGPAGPPGTPGDLVEEDPAEYVTPLGFTLTIPGQGTVTLRSFAGCRVEAIGSTQPPGECYFSVSAKWPVLWTWLDDSLQGVNVHRDLEIRERSSGGGSTAQLHVQNAFLTEFRIDGVDAASSDPATVTFVVQPAQVQSVNPTPPPNFPQQTNFLANRFGLSIGGLDMSGTLSVGPIVVEWPTGSGGTKQPGTPSLLPFEVTVSGLATSGDTAEDLQEWVDDVIAGTSSSKNGSLTLLGVDGQTVLADFQLQTMLPASGLDPLGTQRTITIAAAALDPS